MDPEKVSKNPEERQDIGYFLTRISHSIQHYFNRLYDQYDITYPQARLLTHLFQAEDMAAREGRQVNINQRELERVLGIKASSVSSLVRNLEGKGFITSQRIESDTRNKRILLTEKARELDVVISRAVNETERSLTQGMEAREYTELLRLMAILKDNAELLSEKTP